MVILNVVIKQIESSSGNDEDSSGHKQLHDTRSSKSFAVGTLPQQGRLAAALHMSIDQSTEAAPIPLLGANDHSQRGHQTNRIVVGR